MKMQRGVLVIIVGILVILAGLKIARHFKSAKADRVITHTGNPGSAGALKLKEAMRELWTEHVLWTREYIIAAVSGLEELKDVTDRLLKNQEDIGNAIVPVYGKDAGNKLTVLLKDHILIAADVVKAAKEGNKELLASSDKSWHDNARYIAQFLSGANPNWPFQDLLNMLNEHLKVTAEEAVAYINKKWSDSIKTFGEVFRQAMMMADALTDGIVKQFPDKF